MAIFTQSWSRHSQNAPHIPRSRLGLLLTGNQPHLLHVVTKPNVNVVKQESASRRMSDGLKGTCNPAKAFKNGDFKHHFKKGNLKAFDCEESLRERCDA